MTSAELQALKQSILDDVRVMMQTTGQVTQYIGARYVPLISDPIEWDADKEYEPLTIVTNQGNSYTSRQFVPKGTPITNEQFWASTGNYNAQIEQYRQEVKNLKTVVDNKADNSALENLKTVVNNKADKSALTFRSIEEFGCNTASDCTSEFKQALASASENGFVLVVPNKTYQLTGPIELPWDIAIEGVNSYRSVLKFTNGIGFISPIDKNGYNTTCNFKISNLKVEGDATYSTVENGVAFKGFFINYLFDNVNIAKFNTAFESRMPFNVDTYNEKYNMVYGDMRELRHLDIGLCNYSMLWYAPDTFFNGLDIHNTQNIGHIQGSVVNAHFWGFKGNISCFGVWSNIEVESNIASTIIFNVEDDFIIDNLHCYNLDPTTQILFNAATEDIVVMADNVFIDPNSDKSTAFNIQLCNGLMTGSISCTLSPKFTSTYKTTLADLMANSKMLFTVLVSFNPIGEQRNLYKYLSKSTPLIKENA